MIIEILFTILNYTVGMLLGLLPSVDALPTEVTTAIDFVVPNFKGLLNIFPFMASLVTVGLLMMSIEISYKTYQAVNWVINKARGSG